MAELKAKGSLICSRDKRRRIWADHLTCRARCRRAGLVRAKASDSVRTLVTPGRGNGHERQFCCCHGVVSLRGSRLTRLVRLRPGRLAPIGFGKEPGRGQGRVLRSIRARLQVERGWLVWSIRTTLLASADRAHDKAPARPATTSSTSSTGIDSFRRQQGLFLPLQLPLPRRRRARVREPRHLHDLPLPKTGGGAEGSPGLRSRHARRQLRGRVSRGAEQ